MPSVLAEIVFDPVVRGAHHTRWDDETTEDLLWSLDFWASPSNPENSARRELIAAVLALHCL